MSEQSFTSSAEHVKKGIDNATTNKQVRSVLKPVLTAAIDCSNRVMSWSTTLNMYWNPIHMLKDIWAPQDEFREQEWNQIRDAISEYRAFLDTVPNTDTVFSGDKEVAKAAAIKCMAAIQTIGQFSVVDKNLWPRAWESFLADVEASPSVFVRAATHVVKATGDALKKAADPAGKALAGLVFEIIWQIIRSLWWVILVVLLIVAGWYYGPYLLGKAAAKMAVPNA